MSGHEQISSFAAVLAAVAVLLVGCAAFWANPRRAINRWFFTLSVHVSAWITCVYIATLGSNGLIWVRISSAAGAFIPLHLWLLKEAVIECSPGIKVIVCRGWIWVLCSLALAIVSFTGWFVPAHSTAGDKIYGFGYYAYMGGLVLLYAGLCSDTIVKMRARAGAARLELQILLLGGSAVAVTVLVLMAVGAVFNARIAIQLQPIIVLVLYAFTVIGINTHRIFDARQVVIVCAEKSVLVLLSCAFAWVLNVSLGPIFPPPLEFLATTALTLWFAGLLNAWLNRAFQAYPQVINARRAAFSAAGKEAQMEELVGVFLSILKGWGRSEHAIVLSGAAGFYQGGGIEISADSSESQLMKEIRWATPERLARERPSPARVALAKFLSDQNLGILVACDGPTLNALVGVGLAASRRPFTYPQVLQLLELAAIIANALERASLSAKAQHAAQLATVGLLGASLAHEIRNPLVAIKTFVQLLPQHYQDQAFRDKFFRVISDEVRRIDRLTEQLLDVAAPRVYSPKLMELHAVLRESLDLVAAKAAGFNVALRSDLLAAPDAIYTDPAAVKQVVLNLCLNAIQAVETQPGDRWIKIVSRNVGNNIELVISDSGPGIAPDIWPRLFETFQSSKSSGFGLGLAICRDILANVNATIVADQPIFGQGATFRVTFPCRP